MEYQNPSIYVFYFVFQIWNFFADLTISILMGLALVLIVESPVIAVEKIIFRRNEDKHKTSHEIRNEFNSYNEKENGKFTTIYI